jgi:NACalpha-BTF3-like transcription factor
LVDHAWTTSPEEAKKELRLNPALVDRLESLMDIETAEAPEDSDDEDDNVKPSEELIKLVALQANVTDREAENALKAENNEVVNAIMVCFKDKEWFMETKSLIISA